MSLDVMSKMGKSTMPSTTARKTTVYLVACASKKQSKESSAEHLYVSSLFEKSRALALSCGDKWFILSSKHGLVDPHEILSPYEDTLNGKSKAERKAWASKAYNKLKGHLPKNARIVFLAGERYREHLMCKLRADGHECLAPLAGLSIGKQLQWLGYAVASPSRLQMIMNLYDSLAILKHGKDQFVPLSKLHLHKLPKKGVYFFFDPDEFCRFSSVLPRIVRVGTHAVSVGSKATLWQRLRTHRGGLDLGGNHRSSIFRLHIGSALRLMQNLKIETWGIGSNAPAEVRANEARHEIAVSRYIGRLLVAHVDVCDNSEPGSDRSYLERNAIALLSSDPALDLPSNRWLGSYSSVTQIRSSGLWNINYVGESYDANCLEVLRTYALATVGLAKSITMSLAPENWHSRLKAHRKGQLGLPLKDA